MMNKWAVLICCSLFVVAQNAAAEVYKWKDASGQIHYSDTPPASSQSYGTLSGRNSTPAPSAAAAPEAAKAPAKSADTAAQKKSKEAKAASDAKDAEIKRLQDEKAAMEKRAREQNCQNARKRVAQFEQGGRMYTVDANGERHYYGDSEIASGLAQAKADVETYCTE